MSHKISNQQFCHPSWNLFNFIRWNLIRLFSWEKLNSPLSPGSNVTEMKNSIFGRISPEECLIDMHGRIIHVNLFNICIYVKFTPYRYNSNWQWVKILTSYNNTPYIIQISLKLQLSCPLCILCKKWTKYHNSLCSKYVL